MTTLTNRTVQRQPLGPRAGPKINKYLLPHGISGQAKVQAEECLVQMATVTGCYVL